MPNIIINPKYKIKSSQKIPFSVEICIDGNDKPFSAFLVETSYDGYIDPINLIAIPKAHFALRGGILYLIIPTEIDEKTIPGTSFIDISQDSKTMEQISFDIIDYTFNSVEQKGTYIMCPAKGYGWERHQPPDRSWGKVLFVQSVVMAIERFYWNSAKRSLIELLDWSGFVGSSLEGHPNNSHSGGLVLDGAYPYISNEYKYPQTGLDRVDIPEFIELVKQIVKLLPKAKLRIHGDYYKEIMKVYPDIVSNLINDSIYHHDNHWHLSLI